MKTKHFLMGAMLLLMLFCGVAVLVDSNLTGGKAIIASALFFAGAIAYVFIIWTSSKDED